MTQSVKTKAEKPPTSPTRGKRENVYYMLATAYGNPLLISSHLPIYWLEDVAREEALKYKAKYIEVKIIKV